MSEELKPCPFCGEKPYFHVEDGVKYVSCINSSCIADASWHEPLAGSETDWNTRPLEDALTARIAELEKIDRMRSESVSTLNQANANNEDEIELLEKRIAELEEQNKVLEAACEILRSDNSILFKRLMAIKTPNNTKKNTIVYLREGEE